MTTCGLNRLFPGERLPPPAQPPNGAPQRCCPVHHRPVPKNPPACRLVSPAIPHSWYWQAASPAIGLLQTIFMKRYCLVLMAGALTLALALPAAAQLDRIKQKIKDKTAPKEQPAADTATTPPAEGSEPATASGNTSVPDIRSYQNYDFVPGDKILFEDNFTDEADGEFPSHWELIKGQGQLNKVSGSEAFYFTEGNYATIKPRMKTDKYLSDPFTIEFEYYPVAGSYPLVTMLQYTDKGCGCEATASILTGSTDVQFEGPVSLSKTYSEGFGGEENFANRWHHIAMAFRNQQLKVYVDQNRVLVVPDSKASFYSVQFGGIGDEKSPIIFRNIRLASGGNMNMIGKKFTESKIVTHGINFDVGKAVIKPESMGTLNMIVKVMTDNPELKFEVDGHTDNTGTGAHNLELSDRRAEAVKKQLVAMGIQGDRLTSKGFGDTQPLGDNNSPEGKANNRRVEFIKK